MLDCVTGWICCSHSSYMTKSKGGSCCTQAFAISVKGRVRPGRFRSDPKDVTACRYDMAPKLLKAITHAPCIILPPVPLISASISEALPQPSTGTLCRGLPGSKRGLSTQKRGVGNL